MGKQTEWSEAHDQKFSEAVQAIKEDLDDYGDDAGVFEPALEHYASLYEIEPEALRHEWNLRQGDAR